MGKLEDLERMVVELRTRLETLEAEKPPGSFEARLSAVEMQVDPDAIDSLACKVQANLETFEEHVERGFERAHALGHGYLDLIDYLGIHDPKTERVLRKAGISRRR